MVARRKKRTKAQLRRLRKRIARRNFGLSSKSSKRRSNSTRVVTRRRRRARRSYSNGMSGRRLMAIALGAAVYNAFRQRISNAIAPLTSKVPLGTVADEVVLAIAGYQLGKRTKGIMGDVGKAAFLVEASRIGVAVADGSAFAQGSSNGVGSGLVPNVGV